MYPHNHWLGTLAEGGVLWLTAMVVFFFQVFRTVYQNWKITLADRDVWGQVICGGAVASFVVMMWASITQAFHDASPKTTLFWLLMAGAVKYAILPPDSEETSRPAGASTASA